MQYPARTGATRCCLVRESSAFEAIDADPSASDASSGDRLFSYKLIYQLRLKNKKPFLGAAVVGRARRVKQADDNSLKVGGQHGGLTVTTCTSQEGFHVIGVDGKETVSDIYLGLGYEVENPTCVPK